MIGEECVWEARVVANWGVVAQDVKEPTVLLREEPMFLFCFLFRFCFVGYL